MKAVVVTKIEKSRTIPQSLKPRIIKLVKTGSKWNNTEYNNGVVLNLRQPAGMSKISKNIRGCSIGADKNGFFVYTHRARSKSHINPLKISKKTIDFIESTG